MDLYQADMSDDQSRIELELIDWNTPPAMVENNTYHRDSVTNDPFDLIESRALNMNRFDLVLNETFSKRISQRSLPLIDISAGAVNILERFKEDKSNDDHTKLVCLGEEVAGQLQENCTQVLTEDNNNMIKTEDNKIESNYFLIDDQSRIELELIDWNTPPAMVENNIYHRDSVTNDPFDLIESRALNMNRFDLVLNETFSKRRSQRSLPLIYISAGAVNILERFKEDKSNDDHTKLVCLGEEVAGQLQENCTQLLTEDNNNMIKNEDYKIESNLTVDHSYEISDIMKRSLLSEEEKKQIIEQTRQRIQMIIKNAKKKPEEQLQENCTQVLTEDNNNMIKNVDNKIEPDSTVNHSKEISDIMKRSLLSEEEKKQIIEQTRQRIQMIIEKAKKDHAEQYTQKSLFRAQLCSHNSSLNKSDSLFNKGFLHSGSNSYGDSSNETPIKTSRSNVSNSLNCTSKIQEISFDLNALEPEWISLSFSDMDDSMDTQNNDKSGTIELTKNNTNNDVDKSKYLDYTGIIESKPKKCCVLQSTQNKDPCIADNIPLQQTVQRLKDEETNENTYSPNSASYQIRPIASSTPTESIMMECKTPSKKSFINSGILRQKILNSINCPSSPLNDTKRKSKNLISNVDRSILSQSNVSHSVTPPSKRSNTTIVMYDGANERKLKMVENLQSFKMNKSKSLSKIGMIQKPMPLGINKRSGLPVPKKFSNSISMPIREKENMKPQ